MTGFDLTVTLTCAWHEPLTYAFLRYLCLGLGCLTVAPFCLLVSEEAKPTGDCPRRNGYYADPDPKKCGSFVHCVDGVSNRVECPSGLVFSLEMGTCQWPDQAGRTGCSSAGNGPGGPHRLLLCM